MTYWDHFIEALIVVGSITVFAIWFASIAWALTMLLFGYDMWWLWRALAGVYAFFALVAGIALSASVSLV